MAAAAPPVVLLHGWGGSVSATFARTGWLAALMTAGREAIAIDLPGHGGNGSCDPGSYADLTLSVQRQFPACPVDIVGFSLGGKLALSAAARWPERVRRMVIGGVGDNLFSPEPSGEALANALENGVARGRDPAVAELVDYVGTSGNDPRALAAVLRRDPNPVLTNVDLAAIGPVLLINGAADRVAQPDIRLRGALRELTYIALDRVDHLSLTAAPAFRNAALTFLDPTSMCQEKAA